MLGYKTFDSSFKFAENNLNTFKSIYIRFYITYVRHSTGPGPRAWAQEHVTGPVQTITLGPVPEYSILHQPWAMGVYQ